MNTPLLMLLKDRQKPIQIVNADEAAFTAASKMSCNKIGSLLVFKGGKLTGILTERDILVKLVANKLDPMKTKVFELMTPKDRLIVASPVTTVSEAIKIMTEKDIRHLPVIEKEELLGMFSMKDASRWIIRHQQDQISSLTKYISGEVAIS